MINKKMTIEALKNYLFNIWETHYFITINRICFDTEKVTLAYDHEFDNIEIYLIDDTDLENVLCSFSLKNIETINDTIIELDLWL